MGLHFLYSTIAFDERVTFWLQCVWSLPCVYVGCIECVCNCVMVIREPHTQVMQHTHKAVTGRVEAKNLLSRRRHLDCNSLFIRWLQIQCTRPEVFGKFLEFVPANGESFIFISENYTHLDETTTFTIWFNEKSWFSFACEFTRIIVRINSVSLSDLRP